MSLGVSGGVMEIHGGSGVEIRGQSGASGGRAGNSGWVCGLWGEGWKFGVGLGSLGGGMEIQGGSGVSGGRAGNSGWVWGLWREGQKFRVGLGSLG